MAQLQNTDFKTHGQSVFDWQRRLADRTSDGKSLRQIVARYLEYQRGILLQPLARNSDLVEGQKPIIKPHRGTRRPLYGVAGSNDWSSWEWRGILEWQFHDPLPEFTVDIITLV